MKLAWPESQKRVSLKWGNIDSLLSSGAGSGSVAEAAKASECESGCWASTEDTGTSVAASASSNERWKLAGWTGSLMRAYER